MKIVTNPKKIKRYYKLGLYLSLGSLAFLFAAVGLTFFTATRPDLVSYPFFAMMVGLILSQVGVYFANRWGKSPRIDERISQGLKGLDDRYVLHQYTAPVPHLLTGPAGVWILLPQYHAGTITYEKNRYHQRGIGFFARVVGQEGLGRPDLEAQKQEEDLKKFLQAELPEEDMPKIQSVIVFTSPKATVQAEGAPIPTIHVEKLKDFIRRQVREQPVNMAKIKQIQELLPAENVEE